MYGLENGPSFLAVGCVMCELPTVTINSSVSTAGKACEFAAIVSIYIVFLVSSESGSKIWLLV